MIIDQIKNWGFYQSLAFGIADALAYLAHTDFKEMPNGKYELDGQRLFAIVQRYRPKSLEEIAWEAHRAYTDVQYVAQGAERMGYAPLNDRLPIKKDYDPQRDIIFFDAQGDLFTASEGCFVVFTPQDVHAPGLAVDPPAADSEVLKVVVKCLVTP